MIRYHCDHCGVYFDEPVKTSYSESVAGRIRRYTDESCPACGCDSFTEANHCPGCGRPKLLYDLLCDKCRADLKARVCAFFDTLTAQEEEQFNEWMDGELIENRGSWS